MEQSLAYELARSNHVGQHDRFGEPVIAHVERVASAVPGRARATAWLHDVLELSPLRLPELRRQGLTDVELVALELLTRGPAEPYETYVNRIADAPGPAGRLARIVKLADLDDHLEHSVFPPGAPPYAWARRRLLAGLGWPPARRPRRSRQTPSIQLRGG